ncbi:MAG: hypothetical protein AB1645_10220, partial [Bacillota bacterium]
MKFSIKRGSPSGRSWGDVDKDRLWRLLSTGLKEGVDGAREAVREMYAVVKADIGPDLPQADCWGPHHEITEDGALVLSRGGYRRGLLGTGTRRMVSPGLFRVTAPAPRGGRAPRRRPGPA